MTYDVIITPAAENDISLAFDYIQARSPLNAERWLRGMYRLIRKLELFPGRCGRAREAETLGVDLRQIVFKSHRIIFRIEQKERIVRVIRVRHGAQGGLSKPEL